MKNKIIIILTFLATVGLIGNAFAISLTDSLPNNGYSGQPVMSVIPGGSAYSNKAGGVGTQTITGEVGSVNPGKNAFIVEDKYDRITATVLTDSQTIASLRSGQMVTVKLVSGSPVARLVRVRSSVNTEVPIGMVSYNKEGGVATQTNMGVVKSVNPKNNVFVLENKHCPLTTLASTDSETIASLHPGQTVSVKLHQGSPRAISVMGI